MVNKSLLVFCLSLLLAANAQALTFTEATDFPGSTSFGAGAFTVGTLDLGTNRISGTLSSECVAGTFACNMVPGTDSQDSFLLQIDQNTRIDTLFVSTSNVTGPTGFSSSFDLRDASTILVSEPDMAINGTTGNLLDSALGAGLYSLSLIGRQALGAGLYTLDWSVEVNASPVPIPAAIWLFGTGLLGLFGVSKYKKT
ncbi:MAG: hypothetical protein ABW096_07115 [Candidatus Thiodiazotropha sp.]